MNHDTANKLLNEAWDQESDSITQDAKAIYESGFHAALNICIPLLAGAQTILNAHSVGYKTQEAIARFMGDII